MEDQEWADKVRRHLAIASVGNSTLMQQAGKGRVRKARQFLIENVPLDSLGGTTKARFSGFLSNKTKALAEQLRKPTDGEPNWGAARKVINIFLRMCAMNKDLNQFFQLANVEPFLELPLDNHIVEMIDEEAGTLFKKSFRIRDLTKERSVEIQNAAEKLARKKKVFRYELDVLFWNAKKFNA